MGQNTFWTKANITKDDMKLKLKGEKLKPKGALLSKKDKKANIEDTKKAIKEFNYMRVSEIDRDVVIRAKKVASDADIYIKLLLNTKNRDSSLQKKLIKKIQNVNPIELMKGINKLPKNVRRKIFYEFINDIYFKDHLQTEDFNSFIKLKKLQKEAGNKKKYYERIARVKEDYLRFIVSSYSKKRKE